MPLLPIATFLAGSLLTLLLPTIMLTLLVIWYVKVVSRVPETEESPAAPTESPTAAPAAAGDPTGERP